MIRTPFREMGFKLTKFCCCGLLKSRKGRKEIIYTVLFSDNIKSGKGQLNCVGVMYI